MARPKRHSVPPNAEGETSGVMGFSYLPVATPVPFGTSHHSGTLRTAASAMPGPAKLRTAQPPAGARHGISGRSLPTNKAAPVPAAATGLRGPKPPNAEPKKNSEPVETIAGFNYHEAGDSGHSEGKPAAARPRLDRKSGGLAKLMGKPDSSHGPGGVLAEDAASSATDATTTNGSAKAPKPARAPKDAPASSTTTTPVQPLGADSTAVPPGRVSGLVPHDPAYEGHEELLPFAEADPDRPRMHVQSVSGWINDPNGPIFFDGRYHVFYQLVLGQTKWDFGIVWGHAVSDDLVRWKHLEPGIAPGTPFDRSGCFSGCCAVEDGRPLMMYTGVRLKNGMSPAGPPVATVIDPRVYDDHGDYEDHGLPGQPFIEAQCIAWGDESDPDLRKWVKVEEPIIRAPPADLKLVGWRDPYIVQPPSSGTPAARLMHRAEPKRRHMMLIGAGIAGEGGTVLVYRSNHMSRGWEYEGELCRGTLEHGAMWECPLLVPLPPRKPAHGRPFGMASAMNRRTSSFVSLRGNPPGIGGGAVTETEDEDAPGGFAYGTSIQSSYRESSYIADGIPLPSDSNPAGRDADAGNTDHEGFAYGTSVASTAAGGASLMASSHLAGRPAELPPGAQAQTWLLCISPDAPTNPVLYWTGHCVEGKFLLEDAQGPYRLDNGDILYAPNHFVDKHGRHLLWGWLQERRNADGTGYAGCLTVPRLLTATPDGRLFQEPVPEVARLRTGRPWRINLTTLAPTDPIKITDVKGRMIDLELFLRRGESEAIGVVLHPASPEAGDDACDAVLLYHWERQTLEVVWAKPQAWGNRGAGLEGAPEHRVGGRIEVGDTPDDLTLRVLIDHSCVEVFTSTGEVLSTRVYRGKPPADAPAKTLPCGIELVSYGGAATIERAVAFEMSSIWEPGASGAEPPRWSQDVPPTPTSTPLDKGMFSRQSRTRADSAGADEVLGDMDM
ncbi:unnamed protein product [Pedinophyceae sp. YPF-701]|nr:unnamed protein product [Pedinophyceae sp. YPF-701]